MNPSTDQTPSGDAEMPVPEAQETTVRAANSMTSDVVARTLLDRMAAAEDARVDMAEAEEEMAQTVAELRRLRIQVGAARARHRTLEAEAAELEAAVVAAMSTPEERADPDMRDRILDRLDAHLDRVQATMPGAFLGAVGLAVDSGTVIAGGVADMAIAARLAVRGWLASHRGQGARAGRG